VDISTEEIEFNSIKRTHPSQPQEKMLVSELRVSRSKEIYALMDSL